MPNLGAEHELLLAIAKLINVNGAYPHIDPLIERVEANAAYLREPMPVGMTDVQSAHDTPPPQARP